jgi:hypothetical protein
MLSDAGLYDEHAPAETMGKTDDPMHGFAASPGDRFSDQETGVSKRVLHPSEVRERDKVIVDHDSDQTSRDAFRELLPKEKVKQELVREKRLDGALVKFEDLKLDLPVVQKERKIVFIEGVEPSSLREKSAGKKIRSKDSVLPRTLLFHRHKALEISSQLEDLFQS